MVLDSPAQPLAGAEAQHDAAFGSNRAEPARAGRTAWLGCLPPLLLLSGLEALVRAGLVPRHLLPAPSDLLLTLVALGWQGLGAHMLASSLRVLVGFAIGASLGGLLGAAVGLNRRAEALIDPSMQALRAIPSLAWVPLLLLWLGIDEAPKITLIALGGLFPVYVGVSSGLRDVDRKLVEMARMLGLGPYALTRRVLLPAALPAVMTGLRNGLSLCWMFMVAAELIAASSGLGYLLTDGRETGRADLVLVAIVCLALLGKLSDTGLRLLEQRWLAWRDSFAGQA